MKVAWQLIAVSVLVCLFSWCMASADAQDVRQADLPADLTGFPPTEASDSPQLRQSGPGIRLVRDGFCRTTRGTFPPPAAYTSRWFPAGTTASIYIRRCAEPRLQLSTLGSL